MFNAPSGNTPSANPITDPAFQQELLKYGYLILVAYSYYEGQEYQGWLKDNKRNGNPKSTLPMVGLLRLLPAILAAHAALAQCTLCVGSMNPSRRAEGLHCDEQDFRVWSCGA